MAGEVARGTEAVAAVGIIAAGACQRCAGGVDQSGRGVCSESMTTR